MSWFSIYDKSGKKIFDTRETALIRDPETNESEEISFGDALDLSNQPSHQDLKWQRLIAEVDAAWAERAQIHEELRASEEIRKQRQQEMKWK